GMDTIGESAARLGISRRSLLKWCRRLGIEPSRHPYDWRYRVLDDNQLRRIAAARAQMPGRQTTDSAAHTCSTLPDGLTGWRAFARLHGVPITTAQKAIASGRLPVVRGRWQVGRQILTGALDQVGEHTAWELWHDAPGFTRCAGCPHE
nr:helix-turn-helix domain-containing protein [Ktedonobacterales bacterium]